jgi:hypothetical protein
MSLMFTWVDFAEDDRRKMADVIALFSDKDNAMGGFDVVSVGVV